MPDKLIPITFGFAGGYSTDLPTQARSLDYFLALENVIPEVSGAMRKVGGSLAINSSAIAAAPDIVGMYDFHRAGTSGSFTQKYVAVTSNGKVYRDDMDGTFDDITGAATIGAGVVPVFCVARDLLLIFTSAANTPLKWNQTGDVAAASIPSGKGAVFHKNRLWVWGMNANPNRLQYSSSLSVEDFTGPDSGNIDLDVEDGDVIIGATSYKGNLIIFKGPNYGSIHTVTGSAPTGGDGFGRNQAAVIRGIPLQTHNSIVPIGDDILFMSDRGIHSLGSTVTYGNFAPTFLTRYLGGHFRTQVNKTNLAKVWGVDYADKSCALWTYTSASGSENDATLGLSYIRLQEEGWKPFTWTRGGISATVRIHPTTKTREIVFGGTDGVAYRQDTSARSLNGVTAYTMRIITPQLLLGTQDATGKPRADQPINLERIFLRGEATGDHDIQAMVTRDESQPEAYTFNQGTAGFILDVSMLDVDSLGAATTRIVYSDPMAAGEARSIQLDISQGGLNEDANILELGIEITSTAQSDSTTL
jgi:hypothetical protein